METRIRRILNDDKQIVNKDKEQTEESEKKQENLEEFEEIVEDFKQPCSEPKEEQKDSKVLKDDGFIPEVAPILRTRTRTYTPITDAQCDAKTVKILKQLLSGINGEFSDSAKYSYQHLITNTTNKELSEILENISMQEIHHMELLGKAIIAFGGIPRFSSANGNFWNARFVNYTTNPNSFLRQNILGEERAIANYQRAINLVTNPSLKALFEEIIEDEREHINLFNKFLV